MLTSQAVLTIIVFGAILITLCCILKSPFKYPYFVYQFDVSGKRNVHIEDIVDNYLNKNGFDEISKHGNVIDEWKQESQEKLEKAIFKNLRLKQYLKSLDDENAYRFIAIRQQTRYKQKNYVKTAYKVDVVDSERGYSYQQLLKEYEALEDIGFQCTLREYDSKKQRNLMTPQLREQIARRDNYTCQWCGRYMPDKVGLHIDHIVPVSKGGKSVPSNLQVLCSICNQKKGNKLEGDIV